MSMSPPSSWSPVLPGPSSASISSVIAESSCSDLPLSSSSDEITSTASFCFAFPSSSPCVMATSPSSPCPGVLLGSSPLVSSSTLLPTVSPAPGGSPDSSVASCGEAVSFRESGSSCCSCRTPSFAAGPSLSNTPAADSETLNGGCDGMRADEGAGATALPWPEDMVLWWESVAELC